MKTWTWRFEAFAEASARLVMENSLDEEHFLTVHPSSFVSYRRLESGGRATFAEFTLKLPFGLSYRSLEWVQFIPPNKLVYRSSLFWGTIDVRNDTTVIPRPGGALFRQDYTIDPAWFWRPLKPFILRRMRKWRLRVWEEDRPLLARRHALLQKGFRDGAPVRLVASMDGATAEGDAVLSR